MSGVVVVLWGAGDCCGLGGYYVLVGGAGCFYVGCGGRKGMRSLHFHYFDSEKGSFGISGGYRSIFFGGFCGSCRVERHAKQNLP